MEELQKAFEEQASALSGAMKGVAIPPNQGVQSGREKSARIGEGAHPQGHRRPLCPDI